MTLNVRESFWTTEYLFELLFYFQLHTCASPYLQFHDATGKDLTFQAVELVFSVSISICLKRDNRLITSYLNCPLKDLLSVRIQVLHKILVMSTFAQFCQSLTTMTPQVCYFSTNNTHL